MKDKELLELAAKAAGVVWIDPYFDYEDFGRMIVDFGEGGIEWNPLISDADAFRLMVQLGLDIELQEDCVFANGVDVQNFQLFEWHSDDKCKATRRAIVRASADIGRMK